MAPVYAWRVLAPEKLVDLERYPLLAPGMPRAQQVEPENPFFRAR